MIEAEQEPTKIELSLPISIADGQMPKAESPTSLIPRAEITGVTAVKEMPSITTLLQRKRMPSAPSSPRQDERTAAGIVSNRVPTTPNPAALLPPPFRKMLLLEPIDLSGLQKALKQHRKNVSLKKLDCLCYLSTQYSEMAYFEMDQNGQYSGSFAYGNPALVSDIRSKTINLRSTEPRASAGTPSIEESLKHGKAFLGTSQSLSLTIRGRIQSIGFTLTENVHFYPVIYNQSLAGFWVCASQARISPSNENQSILLDTLAKYYL